MSGSKRWFTYRSDDGQDYAILADKSNTQAVNTVSGGSTSSVPSYGIPKNIRPRYALFRSDDGLYTRKVPILTPADYAALTPGQSYTPSEDSTPVRLSAVRGEKINFPKVNDTGLTTP